MRAETRRKLERALWLDRAKKAGIGVAVLAVVGLLFLYEDYDAHIDIVRVPATVVSVEPLNTNSTKMVENGLSVDVKLDSGKRVNVLVLKTSHPHIGDHVQIAEHRHHTGRITYSWR
jgi:F420-0:gamma-glutamyl ligase-like protein